MKQFLFLFLLFSISIDVPVFGQTATRNKRVDTLKNSQTRQSQSEQQGSQKKTVNQRTGKQKTKPKFSVQMSRAASDFKWCQTYFGSFKKSKEIDYLKLSGKYCKSAVLIYSRTQNDQSKKSKFHYQAQGAKLKVCDYYQSIRNYSLQRRKSEQLPKLRSNYCLN